METKLKQIYQIETESKHNKLLEELNELTVEVKKYIKDPTEDSIRLVIDELVDVFVVVAQLALCKHSVYLAEIKAVAREKINLNVCIGKTMKRLRIVYKDARKMWR